MNKRFLLLSLMEILILSLWTGRTAERDIAFRVQKEAPLEPRARRIPLEEFFKNPTKTNFKISPEGKFISFLAPYYNRLNIHIQETGQNKAVCLTSETKRDIQNYYWIDDSRLIFLKDQDGDEKTKLYSIDLKGSLRRLTDIPNASTSIISSAQIESGDLIIGLDQRTPGISDVYRLNVNTGKLELMVENPGPIISWMADNRGCIRMGMAKEGADNAFYYRKDEKDDFQKILSVSWRDFFSPEYFAPDNTHVYAYSNIGRDKIAIVEFDPGTAKETRVIYENPDYDAYGDDEVDRLFCSPHTQELLWAVHTTWRLEYHFFDQEERRLYENMIRIVGDYDIEYSSFTRGRDKCIFRAISDRQSGRFYLYDRTGGDLQVLNELSLFLDEKEMAPMQPITYPSRDNLIIHAYLTIPKGHRADKLPLIVFPHAGPYWRNAWGFHPVLFPYVQFFANRGYAVFQPNFRGSTGYGKRFKNASNRQWGLKMQDDITDGVEWLIQQGMADSKRIAIFGLSFGGYAVLAGLTLTPDLYACGIDFWGPSNLFSRFEQFPRYREMLIEQIGDPEKDKEQLIKTSPVFNADKIRAPLFIAQGGNDPRVNRSESDSMVEAMKKRGVDVEYILKMDEGHSIQKAENKIEIMEKVERFLKKYLR